jgi:hypothetical protein
MPKFTLAILTALISGGGIAGITLSAQAAQSHTQTISSSDPHSTISLTGKRCGAARKYSRPHYRR